MEHPCSLILAILPITEVSDLTSRPFVINRDVEAGGSDERKILIDISEYDGMVESPSVQPLTATPPCKP